MSIMPGQEPQGGAGRRGAGLYAVALLSALYTWWFHLLAMDRYDAFYCGLDLIQIDSACHGAAHGKFMWANPLMNNFSELHFSPILLLVSAYYLVGDSHSFIFLFQSASAGFAAVPLFIFARRTLDSGLAGFLAAAAYLANGDMQMGILFDYHDYSHFPLFFFSVLAALAAGRHRLAFLSAALLLFTKEDAFITLAGAGLYAYVARRDKERAALIWLTCLVYAAVVFLVVLPHFRNSAGEPAYPQYRPAGTMKGEGQYKFAGRYAWLGQSPGQIASKLREDPRRAQSWKRYATQFLALPLFSPLGLAMALLPSMELFLSSYEMSYRLFGHYPMLLAATWFPAAILGIANIGRIAALPGAAGRRTQPAVIAAAGALLASQLFFASGYGALPLGGQNPGGVSPREREHGRKGRAALSLPPREAVIAAVPGLLTHLNHYPNAYLFMGPAAFPFTKLNVEYVAMDGFEKEGSAKSKWFADDPMQLLMAPGYGLVAEDDEVYIFRKGADKKADYEIFLKRFAVFFAKDMEPLADSWRSPAMRLFPGEYAAEYEIQGKGRCGEPSSGIFVESGGRRIASGRMECGPGSRAVLNFTVEGEPAKDVRLGFTGPDSPETADATLGLSMSYEMFLKNTGLYIPPQPATPRKRAW
jgi:hypothetical protein